MGNGADDVTLRRSGTSFQIFDNNAAGLLRDVPLQSVRSVLVTGTPGEANRFVVDYSFGGFFEIAGGITLTGKQRRHWTNWR